jgi:hypothetical protein
MAGPVGCGDNGQSISNFFDPDFATVFEGIDGCRSTHGLVIAVRQIDEFEEYIQSIEGIWLCTSKRWAFIKTKSFHYSSI